MIDEEAFRRLSPPNRKLAEEAVIALYQSGLLTQQEVLEDEKVLLGSTEEPPISVAHRVLQYRATRINLHTLRGFAEQFMKESTQ